MNIKQDKCIRRSKEKIINRLCYIGIKENTMKNEKVLKKAEHK